MAPIADPALKERIVDEILGTMCNDNVKAWRLGGDGSYQRLVAAAGESLRSQQSFMEMARERARGNEGILGFPAPQKSVVAAIPRAIDKLRRRGKKRKRKYRDD
jgi:polyphosphate kinase